jgi:hypothetical protein
LATKQLRGRSTRDLAKFISRLAEHRGKAAIYCYSAHGGPCRSLVPVVDVLTRKRPNLFQIDIGAQPAVARRMGEQATPTDLLVEDGRIQKAVLEARGLGAIKIFLGQARASLPVLGCRGAASVTINGLCQQT